MLDEYGLWACLCKFGAQFGGTLLVSLLECACVLHICSPSVFSKVTYRIQWHWPYRIILETDADVIAGRVAMRGADADVPLSEQVLLTSFPS